MIGAMNQNRFIEMLKYAFKGICAIPLFILEVIMMMIAIVMEIFAMAVVGAAQLGIALLLLFFLAGAGFAIFKFIHSLSHAL